MPVVTLVNRIIIKGEIALLEWTLNQFFTLLITELLCLWLCIMDFWTLYFILLILTLTKFIECPRLWWKVSTEVFSFSKIWFDFDVNLKFIFSIPLHISIQKGFDDVTLHLIDSGANLDLTDENKRYLMCKVILWISNYVQLSSNNLLLFKIKNCSSPCYWEWIHAYGRATDWIRCKSGPARLQWKVNLFYQISNVMKKWHWLIYFYSGALYNWQWHTVIQNWQFSL